MNWWKKKLPASAPVVTEPIVLPIQPPKPPPWFLDWEKVKDSLPIGTEFEYDGTKMRVVGRREPDFANSSFTDWLFIEPPELLTEYTDKIGVIHEHHWGVDKFPLLLQPRKEK